MKKHLRAFADRYRAAITTTAIFLLIAISASAQTYDTSRVKQANYANPGYSWLGADFKLQLKIPVDTIKLAQRDSGSIAIKSGYLWYWTGAAWDTLSAVGGGGGTADGNNYPTGISFDQSIRTLTITRNGLSSLTEVLPLVTTSLSGLMSAANRVSLDSAVTRVRWINDSVQVWTNSLGNEVLRDTAKAFNFMNSLEFVSPNVAQLKNDQASPGANKVYGTDASGVKGWKADPAGGGSITGKLGVVISGGEAYADSTYRAPTMKNIVTSSGTNLRTDASSVIRLNDGSLYLATTAFGSASGDNDSAVIVSYRSFDNGRTWTDKDTVVPMSGTGVYIPSLYYNNSNDTLRVLYFRQNTTVTGQIYGAYSVDNGETWSAGASVYGSGSEYYAQAADRVLRLKNGNLIFPFCVNTNGTLTSSTGNYRGRLLRSTNGGATWSLVAGVDIGSPDSLCVEPGVFQTDDQYNIVTFYFRTRSGYVGYAKSTDSSASTFGAGYLSALPAPNSTTTIIFDEEHRQLIAAHNRLKGSSFINGIGGRYVLDLSVSPGNDITNSWFNVLRIDSATNRHFIEPTLTRLRSNEILTTYSRGDVAIGDTFDLTSKIIPLNYIKNADVKTITGLKIKKPFDGTSSDMVELYSTSLSETANFFKLGNQTSGNTFFAPWWRLATVRNQGDMLLTTVDAPTSTNSGSFHSLDAATSGAAVANTQRLFSIKNNGSNKFDVFGDGRIRIASFAGDVTSPANGEIWYNSTAGKFRAQQAGSTVDLIGAGGGGSYIASNAGTTLTGNADITQSGFRFSLNEQLLIGTNTVLDPTYMLQINKVSTSQTTAYMGNVGTNTNGNEFRFIKQTATSGYDVPSSTWVGAFNGNTIGKFGLIAGNDLAGDNYRNLDFLVQSRTGTGAMSERFRVPSDGAAFVTKRGGSGSSAKFLSLFQGDQSTTTPVFSIENGTTGTAGGSPFIYTNSLGTMAGYGIPWDINTTANTDGFSLNLRNSASAIANGNWLFRVSNNSTNRFGVKGNGDIYAAGLSVATASDTKILVKGASDSVLRQSEIKTVGGTSLFGSGDIPVATLPSQTGNADKFLKTDGTTASWAHPIFPWDYAIRDSASTSNAVATTAHTITLDANSRGIIEVRVEAISSDGSKGLTGIKRVRYKKIAGTLTLGTVETEMAIERDGGLTTADFTITTSSNNVIIQVTGESAQSLDWKVTILATNKTVFP